MSEATAGDSSATGDTRDPAGESTTHADGATAFAALLDRTTLVIVLSAVFVTSLVTAQLTSAKLSAYALPLVGVVTYPTGTLAYAGTFLATDVTGELLGKDAARRLVNVGFVMNFVMLGFVGVALLAPVAEGGASQSSFATVIGASFNVVLGSLLAYVVSQNWDVVAFHGLREWTDGRLLWLRNVASTGTSQLVDTVLFTVVAFAVAPAVLGVGVRLPASILATTVVGQYVLKLLIAVADTPLVYAAVGLVRRRTDLEVTPASG